MISDALNDMFVTGLLVLVPVHQQRSVVTSSSVRACFGLPLLLTYLRTDHNYD